MKKEQGLSQEDILAKMKSIDKSDIPVADDAEAKPAKKKVEVFTEHWGDDQTIVLNKDPNKTYRWGRPEDNLEMVEFRKRGYEPAMGDEVAFGMTEPNPGKPKMRDGRILMCCPKDKFDARQREMVAQLNAQKKGGNKKEAERLQASAGSSIGVKVYEGME
jgi:hypothetical protein